MTVHIIKTIISISAADIRVHRNTKFLRLILSRIANCEICNISHIEYYVLSIGFIVFKEQIFVGVTMQIAKGDNMLNFSTVLQNFMCTVFVMQY